MKKQFIFILVILSIAIGVGYWRETKTTTVKSPTNTKQRMSFYEQDILTGTILPHTKPLPPFTFTAHNDQTFSEQDLLNRWTFLFFGYTQCPELCPKTLSALAHISQRVGPNPNVQYVFISITPDIDTPEQLRNYFEQDKFKLTRFIGLNGSNDAVQSLANELGIYVADELERDDLEHLGHSGAILLINPKAELYGLFTAIDQPHQVAHDFKKMLSVYARS